MKDRMDEVTRRLAVLGLALLAATTFWDCGGGCGCGPQAQVQVPETPEARLEAYAARLPAQTDMAFFFTDMASVRTSAEVLSAKFEGVAPFEAYRQEIKEVIGLDLLDAASTEEAGVHPEGGFAVGYYRDAPLVFFYVSERKKFQEGVLASLKRYYRVEQAELQPVEGVRDAFFLKEPGVNFGVAYLSGGLTMMVGQGVLADARGADEVLKELVAQDAASSLGKSDAFKDFKTRVGTSWPGSVYMNTAKLLALYQSIDASLPNYQKEMIDAVGAHIRWGGAGWRADGAKAEGQVFFGISPETMKLFEGLDKPGKATPRFKLMVGDKAYAFVRVAVSAEVFWREYFKLMPKRQQRFFKKIVGNFKSTTQIDIEEDLIGNLTGHVGVVLYDFNPLMAMARRANERMKVVTITAHVQLKAPEKLVPILDRVTRELGMRKRELPGGIQVWGFDPQSRTAPPFALYLRDDLLTLASTELGDERIQALLTGDAQTLRKGLKGQAAQKLLDDDVATGLYINVPRIQQRLGILAGRMVNNILGPQREWTVLLSVQPDGISGQGSLTFEQDEGQGAGEAGGDKE